MIFVTVGYSQYSFDRMVSTVDNVLLWLGVKRDDVFFQIGPANYVPRSGPCCTFLNFDNVLHYIKSSNLVITHAGVGSILLCLINNRNPIVFPRLRKFGEHVDDHQLQIASRLSESGLVYYPTGVEELKDTVRSHLGEGKEIPSLPEVTEERGRLIKTINSLITGLA